MKQAGRLTVVVAMVLLGMAFLQYRADVNGAAQRLGDGFSAIAAGNDAAVDAAVRSEQARRQWITGEAGIAMVLLAAGAALAWKGARNA